MKYYIADLHFYHRNLNTQMDKRGFESAEAMNEYMIEKWNSKVKNKDEVIVLGDMSMGKGEETNAILRRLKGKICLIRGNHDSFLNDKKLDRDRFLWIDNYREINDCNRKVVLSHYPIFCYNNQYRKSSKGDPKTYMLYGHVHNTYDEVLVDRFIKQTRESTRLSYDESETFNIPCNMINCFCMFSDYTPLSLDEWIELDAKRRENIENYNQESEND